MDDETTGQWGIVELMGHKVVAGFISKTEMLGKPLLRVDVPQTSAYPPYTQLYGEAAIYCVTFASEEVARRAAESYKVNPVSVYVPDLITREQFDAQMKKYEEQIVKLRSQRALPAQREEPDDEDTPDLFPCSRCGETCSEDMMRCPNCGNRLDV